MVSSILLLLAFLAGILLRGGGALALSHSILVHKAKVMQNMRRVVKYAMLSMLSYAWVQIKK
jgi:hypothetical protein